MQGQARKEKTNESEIDKWAFEYEVEEILGQIDMFLDEKDIEFNEIHVRPGKIILRGFIGFDHPSGKDIMTEVMERVRTIQKDVWRTLVPKDGKYEVRFRLMDLHGDDAGAKLADMLMTKFRYNFNRDIIKAIADDIKPLVTVSAYLDKVVVFDFNNKIIKWYDELEIHTGEEEGYDEIHGW